MIWELVFKRFEEIKKSPNYRHNIIIQQAVENAAIPFNLQVKAIKEADYKYPDSDAVWLKLGSVITELYNEIILGMGEDY